MELYRMMLDKEYEFFVEEGNKKKVYYPSKYFLSDLYTAEGLEVLIEDDPFIIGSIKDGYFVEYFTNKKIKNIGKVKPLSSFQLLGCLHGMDDEGKIESFHKVVNKAFFNKNSSLNYNLPSMEKLARIRSRQMDAYNSGVSNVNPYSDEYNNRHYAWLETIKHPNR